MKRRQKQSRAKKVKVLAVSCIAALAAGAVTWYALSAYRPYEPPSHQSTTKQHEAPAKHTASEQLACVADMPLTQRIGQKLMAAGYSDLLDGETSVFALHAVGGVIVMDAVSAEQIMAFRNAMPITPLVAVDQEGGTVQRYKTEGLLPGAEQLANTESANTAYQLYLADSTFLKEQGITTNFAPVVDVISHTPSPLPDRMYSSDPTIVTEYATVAIKAMQQAGITPVVKHFPGLGSAAKNTDFEATTTDPITTLQTRDLIPYQAVASLHPDAMIGNMIVPGLTDGQPAVWSEAAVDLLRRLGYEKAVIYSDSLTAEAVPGSLSTAVIKSWQAGVDIALIAQTREDTDSLDKSLKAISDSASTALQSSLITTDEFNTSVLRILTRKQINPCELGA